LRKTLAFTPERRLAEDLGGEAVAMLWDAARPARKKTAESRKKTPLSRKKAPASRTKPAPVQEEALFDLDAFMAEALAALG
jgi:hypothetical protein